MDKSGWIVSRVLVVKQTLLSVDIMDGEFTTVVTARTSLYGVTLPLEVRNLNDNVIAGFCVQTSLRLQKGIFVKF